MLIQAEPNGLLMMRYKLYFNQQSPDPEDPWVQAYLEQHGLEPRRQLAEEHDGMQFRVLHFGQCYLGGHLEAIGELYRQGVEYTVLARHIGAVLEAADAAAVQTAVARLDQAALHALAGELAAQLHPEAHFEVTDDNDLHVSIDSAAILQAFAAAQQSARPH